MTRVLIYGGRDWDNQAQLDRVLDVLHLLAPFTLVINGGQVSHKATDDERAPHFFGADWQAAVWAGKVKIPVKYFYANWVQGGQFRKAAGPERNQRMLVEGRPDIAVEFPGGRGTKDMHERLVRAGITPILAADLFDLEPAGAAV
jgi:hypothetical protein